MSRGQNFEQPVYLLKMGNIFCLIINKLFVTYYLVIGDFMRLKLKHTLAITLLMISMAFMPNSLWAQETPPEETPLDESAAAPEEVPTDEAKYSGPPIINYYLSDDDSLIIKVDGLLIGDIDGFSWNGANISEMVGQFKDDGTVELTERDDGFQMLVNIPIQGLAGQNEFGLLYSGENKLSATVDSEKLVTELKTDADDKGFGYTRVFGKIKERNSCCWCGRCGTQYASYARIYLYAWNGGWVYKGSTTTNSSGYYNVYIQGNNTPYIHVVAEHNGKRASATYSGPACACRSANVRSNLYLQ
jgi:hypothetical protein